MKTKMVYVYVQEGGSSDELYLSAWSTLEEAEAGRKEAAEHTWRTSPVVAVPERLAQDREFCEIVEELINASNNVE